MASKKPKLECFNCKGTDFYLQDGLYFCDECDVQHENFREMKHEDFNENFPTTRRLKFSKGKGNKDFLKARRLTSFEEYNHILIGFIDEILNMENIPDFKVTCLQLWISYLRVSEAAFFDKEKTAAPKLFGYYRKADAEILYNKKPKEPKKRERKKKENDATFETAKQVRTKVRRSVKNISQQLSESLKSESMNNSSLANLSIESIISDHEDAELDIHFSNLGAKVRDNRRAFRGGYDEEVAIEASIRAKAVPRSKSALTLNGHTLLFIIYCALNICKSKIQLTDLIRFVLEGHLSFYRCKLLLPDELIEQDIELSHQQHHSYRIINYDTFRVSLSYFIRLIPDLRISIEKPNLIQLAHRYLDEMHLPNDLKAYVERLMVLLPSEMKFSDNVSYLPNFEGRSMAFIIFALKLLFGLDGYRDEEMSESARKVNEAMVDGQTKIFVYQDWMEFIEYRQCILGKFYHPALFHRSYPLEKPYLAFNAMLNSLNSKTPNMERLNTNVRNLKRKQSKASAQEILSQFVRDIETNDDNQIMHHLTFHSFTPMKDYFEQIQVNDTKYQLNQSIAGADYTKHSCEAYLKPHLLVKSFKTNEQELRLKKSTFPKSFTFLNHETSQKWTSETFEADFDGLTELKWQKDLKNRQKVMKTFKNRSIEIFHEATMKQVLKERRKWREIIREDKVLRRAEKKVVSFKENEAETLTEPNILSESDDDSENDREEDEIKFEGPMKDELDLIFESFKESSGTLGLTFVTPDFNLWQRVFPISEVSPANHEQEMEKLPKSFLWLLKFAANILQQHPLLVYHQLICIEHQFVNVYQPVELMKNAMKQKPSKGKKLGKLSFRARIENSW